MAGLLYDMTSDHSHVALVRKYNSLPTYDKREGSSRLYLI